MRAGAQTIVGAYSENRNHVSVFPLKLGHVTRGESARWSRRMLVILLLNTLLLVVIPLDDQGANSHASFLSKQLQICEVHMRS